MTEVNLEIWRNRIENATNVRELTDDSKNWCNCAVGDRIVLETGIRSDSERNVQDCINDNAKSLGVQFHEAMMNDNKGQALKILTLIEKLETVFKND